ncbi:MAG: DUF2071 domain-containing protein [Pyrinomonadaceae bacterium]
MRLPVIQGLIRRRIFINFRVDPQIMHRQLPPRLQPKLQAGYAVAGICLIRLEHIRPRRLPALFGMSSENAAHRVAVTWTDDEGTAREGVFIPRRDTNSRVARAAGGRLFPGEHHHASFKVRETETEINLSLRSLDSSVAVEIEGKLSRGLPPRSIFKSLAEASAFFEAGSLGYSVTSEAGRLDGLMLKTEQWRVTPLALHQVYSSYFADEAKFPHGSAKFDHALLMRDIEHEWHSVSDLRL